MRETSELTDTEEAIYEHYNAMVLAIKTGAKFKQLPGHHPAHKLLNVCDQLSIAWRTGSRLNKLINALFTISSRIWETQNEMDKLAEDCSETDKSEDFHRFKLPAPLEEFQEDEEDHEGIWTPLSVSVTHSGKRRVMELQKKPRTKRHKVPQLLLSSDAVTRIRGAAQWCPGGLDSPIEL